MKVEYIQCDICGNKIDKGYKLYTEPLREGCLFTSHNIDICENCAEALHMANINVGNKKIPLVNKIF